MRGPFLDFKKNTSVKLSSSSSSKTVLKGILTKNAPHLSPDRVRDGGDKLAPETEVGADLPGKLLGRVVLLGEVPLELVNEGDVAHVDVELDHHPFVRLLIQQVLALAGEALQLLVDGRSDRRDKVDRVEIQVVADDLAEHLRGDEGLVLVPQEGVAKLLALDVHVHADGDQHLRGKGEKET